MVSVYLLGLVRKGVILNVLDFVPREGFNVVAIIQLFNLPVLRTSNFSFMFRIKHKPPNVLFKPVCVPLEVVMT